MKLVVCGNASQTIGFTIYNKPNNIMVKIKGSTVNKDIIAPKCNKYLQQVTKMSKIDLDNIGDRKNNALVELLRCQVKATKTCTAQQKNYESCHSSVMGTGNHEGRKNCGIELELLYKCALSE